MSHAGFVAALLNADLAVPEGLIGPGARPAGKRFSVYRNNVAVGLTEALSGSFPVLRKILGDEFFDAMAGVFLRLHPPSSPLMMFYGAEMPAFLAGFAPVSHLGYLADVARLELALRHAYHAADSTSISPEKIAAMPPEALMGSAVSFAPAVRLIRSAWPIYSIWRANTETGAPGPVMRAEDVLVARPQLDAAPHLLPDGGGAVVAALMAGATLGAAFGESEVDANALFAVLITQGAITDLKENTP